MKSAKLSNKYNYYYLPGIILCFYFISISSIGDGGRIYTLSDDIMISMSYAKTFANTGELVWYEGSNRVQGFTNFLYTIFLSFIHLFKFDLQINSLIVSLVNVIFLLIIAIKVTSLALILSNGNKRISYFLGGLIFFQYPLIFWSLRGYEVGIISLLLILIIEQIVKFDPSFVKVDTSKILKIYILISVGILIRIDFLVILLGVSSYFFLFKVSSSKEFFLFIKYNLFVGFVIFFIFLFQYFYYGDFLPNTYYLKTGGFALIEKLPRGVLSSFNLLPLLIFIFFTLINKFSYKENLKTIFPIFSVSFFLILYNVYIGGDAWEVYGFANRFITPIIPLVFAAIPMLIPTKILNKNKVINVILLLLLLGSVFLIQLNVNQLLGFESIEFKLQLHEIIYIFTLAIFIALLKKGISSHYILAILFTLFLSSSHFQYMYNEEVQITSTDYLNVAIGKKINLISEPKATVGLFWAGNLSYYIDRPSIDLLGKSDRVIAKSPPVREQVQSKYNFSDFFPGHNKWNFKYSIGELMPDIIIRPSEDREFIKQIESNGYKKYCIKIISKTGPQEFPIFIRNNSMNVKFDKVIDCSV